MFDIAAIISMFIVVLVISLRPRPTSSRRSSTRRSTGVDRRRPAGRQHGGPGDRTGLQRFTQSAFAQNVGACRDHRGEEQRFVVTAGGVVLLVLGMLPVLGRVVAAIPYPPSVAPAWCCSGRSPRPASRSLSKVDYNGNMNPSSSRRRSVRHALIAAPSFYDEFPEWVGNIFHSHQLRRDHGGAAEPAVQPPAARQARREPVGVRDGEPGDRLLDSRMLSRLRNGDRIEDLADRRRRRGNSSTGVRRRR
ncbi:hypothetical protein HBB16_07200 [Pseudonocardia sp. MCCB 268]|nr:hypothetical protein [Pseudonocardia cytotoxica]